MVVVLDRTGPAKRSGLLHGKYVVYMYVYRESGYTLIIIIIIHNNSIIVY